MSRILGIAFGRVKKLSVLASGSHMRLLVPTISPTAPLSTFLPQNCKFWKFSPGTRKHIFSLGSLACMKFGWGLIKNGVLDKMGCTPERRWKNKTLVQSETPWETGDQINGYPLATDWQVKARSQHLFVHYPRTFQWSQMMTPALLCTFCEVLSCLLSAPSWGVN